jgi:hypothetical protein
VLREIDLAGDPVRETNLAAVNAQLTALGRDPIYGFYHEAQHLPGGGTVVLGITERTFDINGTPTDYVGTMVIVLDDDLRVTWAWDAFDHLDIHRGPVLGEIDDVGDRPVDVVPRLPAVDWLHNNTVAWSPADGNLILSFRTQDWVVKIDYRNGEGDGHVVWRLGQDGDFTVQSGDPNPWFSHQHQVHYIDDSTLIVMDNGNTRHASDPDANSRGQVWVLDEQALTATLVANFDLGAYSQAEGGAQRLSNGDYSFTLGNLGQAPNVFGQTVEVRPDGSVAHVLEVNSDEFRSYRIRTLYEGISDQVGSGGGGAGPVAGSSPRQGSASAAYSSGDRIAELALAGQAADHVSVQPGGAGWVAYPGSESGASPAMPPATSTTIARVALPADRAVVDQVFEPATGPGRVLALSHPRLEPLNRAALVDTDRVQDDWLFPAVSGE